MLQVVQVIIEGIRSMNIIIVIAVALSALLLVAIICCIVAVLNPPKKYIGTTVEENVIGKEGEFV